MLNVKVDCSLSESGTHPTVRFVYLKGSYELLRRRLCRRANHFMKAPQFQQLEEPEDAVVVDASLSIDEAVTHIRDALQL